MFSLGTHGSSRAGDIGAVSNVFSVNPLSTFGRTALEKNTINKSEKNIVQQNRTWEQQIECTTPGASQNRFLLYLHQHGIFLDVIHIGINILHFIT